MTALTLEETKKVKEYTFIEPKKEKPVFQKIIDDFDTNGYLILQKIINDENCKALSDRIINYDNPEMDDQCPKSYAVYALYDDLLESMTKTIESASGKKLYPTYSYARIYKNGEILKEHTDRPACEISVTITLSTGTKPWPIKWKNKDNIEDEALLNAGDGFLYKGCEVPHYRTEYDGEDLIQVFLHYVDQNGPYADEKFDRRSALGTTKEGHNVLEQDTAFDYWYYENVISPDMCDYIINAYKNEDKTPGLVGGNNKGEENPDIRNVEKVNLAPNDFIMATLYGYGYMANANYWNFDIQSNNFQSEFLTYNKEGRYVEHVDASNDFIKYRQMRKLTVLLFLNDDFENGNFFLRGNRNVYYPPQSKGTILIFPSYLSHGVEDINSGTRYSIVAWLSGPNLR